jgi:cupin fold WbuC family metalloprotein
LTKADAKRGLARTIRAGGRTNTMAVLTGKKATEAQLTTRRMLDEISIQAKQSPRLRKNYNFHHSDGDICHRLLNAMEPGSYIQPHRHLDRNKDETLVVIRGKMGLILFDDHGNIEEKAVLELADHAMIVNIPHGKFHTWISFEERSIFFESKAGPFLPLTEEEKAFWAPKEGDASSAGYLASLKEQFESDKG